MKLVLLALAAHPGFPSGPSLEPCAIVAVEDFPPDVSVEPRSSRAWALATSAPLIESNQWRHDLLASVPIDATSVDALRSLLEEWWGIATPKDLTDTLGELEASGHRVELTADLQKVSKLSQEQFDEALASAEDDEERAYLLALRAQAPRALKIKGGLLAWDLSRYVTLCRWGYGSGLMSESEAWKRIERIARRLQKAYASWEDLGEAYCIGRECWNPGQNEKMPAACERLKTSETSPWKLNPWDQKLDKLDKPAKAPSGK